MLKKLFGFGADKRAEFNNGLANTLRAQFSIELDPEKTPKIGIYTGFVETSSHYFYQKRTPEHCALAIALLYYKGLSSSGNAKENERAQDLRPKILSSAKNFALDGTIPAQVQDLVKADLDR
jgi:hypothetical protein